MTDNNHKTPLPASSKLVYELHLESIRNELESLVLGVKDLFDKLQPVMGTKVSDLVLEDSLPSEEIKRFSSLHEGLGEITPIVRRLSQLVKAVDRSITL